MSNLLVDAQQVQRARDILAAITESMRSLGGLHGSLDEVLAQMVLPAAPGVPAGPTVYAQRNWSGKMLGKSTRYTIGSSGCLLCSVCSAEHDAGMNMDPAQFNDWMVANNGFLADGEGQIVNFVFSRPDKLGFLKFDMIAKYPNRPPTPAPIAKMDQYIKDGGFIVVEVDFNPATVGIEQHWCRALGTDPSTGKFMVMDPWYGDIVDVAKRYRPGLTAAEAIIAAAYYKKV